MDAKLTETKQKTLTIQVEKRDIVDMVAMSLVTWLGDNNSAPIADALFEYYDADLVILDEEGQEICGGFTLVLKGKLESKQEQVGDRFAPSTHEGDQ